MTPNLTSPRVAVNGYQSISSPPSRHGSIYDHKVFDPEELTRLLRRRAYTPEQDELTAMYEERAKRDHDRLIEMGGRPTRPVQLQPSWNATYRDGLIFISNKEGELDCTLSDDIDPMNEHWSREMNHFQEELDNWQRFRKYQQEVQHLDRLETELELENTDARLIKALSRLSDWEEFEVFQSTILTDASGFEDRNRRDFSKIIKLEITGEHQPTSSVAHDAIGPWLRVFDRSQEQLEAAKNQLKWIKDQWPKVVAEAVDSVSKTPELLSDLEAKFRKQTYATFSAIENLGGRPSHPVNPPDESTEVLLRILYWSSETSNYREELVEWKTFLQWRRHYLGKKSTIKQQEYRCPQFQSASDFSAEFEKFRLCQYKIASTWLKCWQRIVRWYEEEPKRPRPFYSDVCVDGYAEEARSHVRDSEQNLAEAAIQLEKSKQNHAHALSQHTGDETKIEYSQKAFLLTPPLSGSESSQSSISSDSTQNLMSTPSPPSSQSSQLSQVPRSPQSLEPPRSPRSSHSPQSSPYPRSPQSPERLSKDRRPSSKSSSAKKGHRRLKKENARKEGASMSNINTHTKQQTLPIFSLDPYQAKRGDDNEMTDGAEALSVADAMEETQEAGADFDDTVMTDIDDPLTHTPPSSSSSSSSQSYTKPITNAEPEKLPLPNARGPAKTQPTTSRKTRSATKLDQALLNGVPKNKKTGQKPAKKAKAFTEQQVMTLLDAASTSSPSPGSIPLRRSERLKEKAAASKRRICK